MRRGRRAEGGLLVPVALLGLFVVGIGLILGTILVASAANEGSVSESTPLVGQPRDVVRTSDQGNREDPTHTPTASPTPIPSPTPTPTSPPAPPPGPISLAEAIDQGLVQQAQITGRGDPGDGNSTGDVINIGLTRSVADRLEIELPRGTVLQSTTPRFQSMVVQTVKGRISHPRARMYSPTSRIVLNDDEEQWFLAEAYCLDLGGDNPEYGTDFEIAGTATPQVLAVLDAAAGMGPDGASTTATQVAIWAVSEDPSRSRVEARFSTDDEDFVQARAILEAAGIDPASTRMFQY